MSLVVRFKKGERVVSIENRVAVPTVGSAVQVVGKDEMILAGRVEHVLYEYHTQESDDIGKVGSYPVHTTTVWVFLAVG